MKMRTVILFLSSIFLLSMCAGASVAFAGTVGAGPDSAGAPPSQWAELAVGQRVWYAFDYAGGDSPILARLSVAPANAAVFSIWTPADVQDWANGEGENPVGRGAANEAFGDDQVWAGSFRLAGRYYVVVDQVGSGPAYYQLSVQGSGVSFPSAATPVENAQPAAPTAIAASQSPGTGPGDAITNWPEQWTPAQAGQRVWYAFDYNGGDAPVLVRLSAVPSNSVSFSVWTPADVQDWANGEGESPVGRGTANDAYGGDQVWAGGFVSAGRYYVLIEPAGAETGYYQLQIIQ